MLDYFVKQQKHSAFPQPSQDAHRRTQNLPQSPNQKTSLKQTNPFLQQDVLLFYQMIIFVG